MQSSSPVPVMVAAPGPGRTVDLRETARSRGQHLVALRLRGHLAEAQCLVEPQLLQDRADVQLL